MTQKRTRIKVVQKHSLDEFLLAKDLRKNNWIYHIRLDRPVMILGFNDDKILFEDSAGVIEEDSIELFIPIPMSKYILKKMRLDGKALPNCGILKYERKNIYFEDNNGNRIWTIKCLFLHNLQNVYYALTNQELMLMHYYFR
jgi:hypothetical protein